MIYKLTQFVPADRCGVWLVKVFHTYTYKRRFANVGEFGKISVRQTKPFNKLRKKKKNKFFFLRGKQIETKKDGSVFYFNNNTGALLKKKLQTRGKRLFGPASRSIRRKKVLNSFIFVLTCLLICLI